MGHFAKVLNGEVIQVIVAEPEFFETFVDTSPGQWIQTSYNTRSGIHYGEDGIPDGGVALRANYAGIGYRYDSVNDVFYDTRPFDMNGLPCLSWTLSAPNWTWTPPIACPEDGNHYRWNEANKTWVIAETSGS